MEDLKVRKVIVDHLKQISQEDLLQIESIEALDELYQEPHSQRDIDDLNAAKRTLKARSLKYQKLAEYIEQTGCNDLKNLRMGLVKEFNSNGKTHMTSNWNYLGCLLIAIIDGFLAIEIHSC